MFRIQHHIITVISVFLSLGIGIAMGITFGDDVVFEQQADVIEKLENHYDELTEENQALQKEKTNLKKELAAVQHVKDYLNYTYGDILSQEMLVILEEENTLDDRHLQMIGLNKAEVMSADKLFVSEEEQQKEKHQRIIEADLLVFIGKDEVQKIVLGLIQDSEDVVIE